VTSPDLVADGHAPEWAPAAAPSTPIPSAGESAEPASFRAPAEPVLPKVQVKYAGFWRRALAFLLDIFVVSSVYTLLLHMNLVPELPAEISFTELSPAHKIIMVMMLIYYVAMEASPVQATLGKRALELAVTDVQGSRISVLRALGRNIGKFLSQVILLLGFVMAGFTPRKQALHDLLAGCLVIRRQ
jgi:uncharacterized RDD family membrane protein YckC